MKCECGNTIRKREHRLKHCRKCGKYPKGMQDHESWLLAVKRPNEATL